MKKPTDEQNSVFYEVKIGANGEGTRLSEKECRVLYELLLPYFEGKAKKK